MRTLDWTKGLGFFFYSKHCGQGNHLLLVKKKNDPCYTKTWNFDQADPQFLASVLTYCGLKFCRRYAFINFSVRVGQGVRPTLKQNKVEQHPGFFLKFCYQAPLCIYIHVVTSKQNLHIKYISLISYDIHWLPSIHIINY